MPFAYLKLKRNCCERDRHTDTQNRDRDRERACKNKIVFFIRMYTRICFVFFVDSVNQRGISRGSQNAAVARPTKRVKCASDAAIARPFDWAAAGVRGNSDVKKEADSQMISFFVELDA